MDGTQRPLVVIGAGSYWDGTRLADRHVAQFLSEYADVLYVDPPMSIGTAKHNPRLADTARQRGVNRVADGVFRYTPRVPPRSRYSIMQPVTSRIVASGLRAAVRTMGRPVSAVMSVSETLLGVVGGRQIFWARDDYSAGGALMNISDSVLRRKEQAAARKADLVVAVTQNLVEKWEAIGVQSVLVPNGVDAGLFRDVRPRPTDVPEVHPTVGFCGTLSARIDLGLLHQVVDSGMSLVLVGWPQRTMPESEISGLLDRPGVFWLGGRDYEELPAYMQSFDVGLVPYTDSAFNRASFPLKTLEYLASGVPVVATNLPGIRYLDTDLITIADTDGFPEAVRSQAATRNDAELVRSRQDLAARHSWASRVETLVPFLGI